MRMHATDQLVEPQGPQVFHLLGGDALAVRPSPTGSVGTVYAGEGLEVVWVAKQEEMIDPRWFSQGTVDLLVVLQGQLRVEFEQPELEPQVLEPGDLLVLPPKTRCRAYRWPRDRQEATIFLAVYPIAQAASSHSPTGGHQTAE
jgi:hypothetical protein